MEPQNFTALLLGKIIKFLTRKLKIGGGTAAPGLASLFLSKNFIKDITRANNLSSVVVTGTNGKTTTARMLSHITNKNGTKSIHNRAGSNLLRGIAASLVESANFGGKLTCDLGIWETDEAVMPATVVQLKPKVIVINNLFRDQLDRFGEIENLRKIWTETVKSLDKKQTLVLNTDDPQIAYLGNQTEAKVLYFGIVDQTVGLTQIPAAADAKFCPNCQSLLAYNNVYVYHMGNYYCPKCSLKKPKPAIFAEKIFFIKPESVEFKLVTPNGETKIKLSVGGLYNIYNALAAAAASFALGIDLTKIAAGLTEFKAAFGRVERFKVDGKTLTMFLVKNPAGFSEVVKTLFATSSKKDVLLALNDNIADGTDVSWIWDVEFGQMGRNYRKVFVTGCRANDLALRLKYAGIGNFELIENDMEKTLKIAIKNSAKNLYLLPTYTAMLELRKILNQMGHGTKFWED